MNNTFKKRIDELGRIVIPKQIRNTFKLKNFDELEMFMDNNTIILKKSIGIELYRFKFDRLLFTLSNLLEYIIVITDKNNNIISISKNIEDLDVSKNIFETSKINANVESLPIIVDSNNLGSIHFINKGKFDENRDFLKNIRDIVIDLIN